MKLGVDDSFKSNKLIYLSYTMRKRNPTCFIKLEFTWAGINGNGDGSNRGNGLLQLLLTALFNVNKTSVWGSNSLGIKVTFFIHSIIGIGLLSVKA